MRPIARVAVLWLLILVVFGAFCAVYWPVRLHQWKTDPANFIAYADDLIAEGGTEKAAHVLETGIAELRPPGPEAYRMLHRLLTDTGQTGAAKEVTPRLLFAQAYEQRDIEAAKRNELLHRAVSAYFEVNPVPRIPRVLEGALKMFAVNQVQLLGAGGAVLDMPPNEHLALLDIAGGAFSLDGMVGETGVRAPLDILVQSGGGQGVQRVAHIIVGEQDLGRRARGMHAALIAPDSGQVLRHWVFDIYDSPPEVERMIAFLREAPDGVIGAFAVFDDGSVNMTPALEQELLNFGLRRMTRVHREMVLIGLRHSFAAIGVKGAAPGSALQAWAPEEFNGYPGLPVTVGVIHLRENAS
jgi:hypothetical protein